MAQYYSFHPEIRLIRQLFRLGHLCWKLSVGEIALILSALRGSNMTLKMEKLQTT